MARYMVTQCGFNDVVGPMFFTDEGKGLSEETRRKVRAGGRNDMEERGPKGEGCAHLCGSASYLRASKCIKVKQKLWKMSVYFPSTQLFIWTLTHVASHLYHRVSVPCPPRNPHVGVT